MSDRMIIKTFRTLNLKKKFNKHSITVKEA